IILNELHYHPKPKLGEIQRRNVTASRIMNDEDASRLWDYISRNFDDAARWALIPEEEPDEWDLEMIEEIKHDPDCHVFVNGEELKKSLGIPEYYEDRTAQHTHTRNR
ncbi:MAG: hypothetical protein IJU07_01065, partial [Synergistaceae bacterium]|nr:hypothetical protein [Synergistaceae bacterium]